MTFAGKLFLWSACLVSSFLSAQTFTLDQALSAPFSSQLTGAPTGGTFAWVTNLQGRRNLWVATRNADEKTYSSHQLTNYTEDDGVEIGDIAWTRDAESIVYVRGGDFEFPERPAPNPDLLSGGIDQEIWVISTHGGEPKKLTTGRAPVVSPVGDVVAFLLKGQIWTISLKEQDPKPQQILHTRGNASSLLWSPDGKSLTFVSKREGHSFIGLYSLDTKTLRYLDPGMDHDDAPAWSPDGRSIAFIRVPYSKHEELFGAKRTGMPWSIRVVEIESGKGREIWRAKEGRGSVFHEAQSQSQLHWTSAGSIIFPWEADGWLHLYSVGPNHEDARLLTPGVFEVDSVTASRDGKSIVYSSNQGDIDRRHIWRLDTTSGRVAEVTRGEGIETEPALSGDGQAMAVLRSDARVPIRPAIIAANGDPRDLAPQAEPATFPAASFVVPQQIIFSSADGMRIHGQLFLPKNARDSHSHPAIVFFHGGSRRQMLLGWHYREYYSNAYGMNQYLASLGYIVLSVNYRSGIGYGEEFREALNYGPTGATEFNDVLGAGLYLRGRLDVDAAHIGIWGGSYGGYLTALALARASDMFAAGVDLHGVHDWNLELGSWLPAYDPEADPQAARTAWLSSPLSSVSTWRSPVLLIQGDDDRNVQFLQTIQLAEALRKQKVDVDELIFPDEIHDFLLHRDWLAAYSAGAEFFAKHLK
jgi:dipeptidyl aminopeptidase/acylaminoacyl peptidase